LENKKANKKFFGIDFAHLRLDGYRNINELYPQRDRLHACETLFGDFDTEVMLLAQDAANYDSLRELKECEPTKNPFRHGENVKTNVNLFGLMSPYFDLGSYSQPNSSKCGLYYANAVWLLKDTKNMSGSIVLEKEIFQRCNEVFDATISNLNKLRLIITMGEKAFQFLKNRYPEDITTNWPEAALTGGVNKFTHNGREYLMASIYHPGALGVKSRSFKQGVVGKGAGAAGLKLIEEDLKKIFAKYALIKNSVVK
jgi:hypothetical protein